MISKFLTFAEKFPSFHTKFYIKTYYLLKNSFSDNILIVSFLNTIAQTLWFVTMGKNFTPTQQAKFEAAKRYLRNSEDMDCLYAMVVIIGPALFGAVIKSNSETVWSRVEKPGQFRLDEIIAYAEIFEISIIEFVEIAQKQHSYNHEQLKKRRPIGRAKYQRPS